MRLRQALIEQSPSLALQRAAADEIAALDAMILKQREMLEQAGGVPAGWKLVPVEPTQEMLAVSDIDKGVKITDPRAFASALWSDMLAAAPAAPQPAQAVPDADAERFRWLIDDRNWNENQDTPSICTSEDVHWGDKARALIDGHMNKD